MMNSLKEKFEALDPKQKKTLLITGIIGACCLLGYWGFQKKEATKAPTVIERAEKPRSLTMDADLIEKSLLREQRQEAKKQEEELARLRKELQDVKNRPQQAPIIMPGVTLPESEVKNNITLPTPEEIARGGPIFPPPPVSPTGGRLGPQGQAMPFPPPPGSAGIGPRGGIEPPPMQKIYEGGIGTLTNTNAQTSAGSDKKKEKNSVYLPPGFMKARLLTGGDISTSKGGGGETEPLLLRIQAPAVLPNMIRANLRQCFLVAEAQGRLDKERVVIRTTTLSCLGPGGQSMIHAPIKGFVVGGDNKGGVAGRVVAKVGSKLARAALAGALEGAGEAINTSGSSQITSGLTGTTTNIVDTGELGKQAGGQALKEAASTLRDFYEDLLKQSTPVIELKADQEVTVIITEGVDLEIKETKVGGISE